MAKNIIKAPRGMQDVLGDQSHLWQFVEQRARQTATHFGFCEIRTPTFEQVDLFQRSVGDQTDVVQKEMYYVSADKGKGKYALKPEGTAGVVRSAIEKGLLKGALPVKLYYTTPCFRHERPQAGRLREFHQFGVELFGAQSPSADVEVIALAKHLFDSLGLVNITLHLNSIGCPVCREGYINALRLYFTERKQTLCTTCQDRLAKNPMRLLDCKNQSCAEMASGAPIMLDFLCEECSVHFSGVQQRLRSMELPYIVTPQIVRGLDYYTKTVFEFVSDDLGAQSTVCGGGRYDGLVAQMGGDALPGLGFGIGLERLLLVMEAQGVVTAHPQRCQIFIGSMGEQAQVKACALVTALRREGIWAECDLMERSVKAQMKYANKLGAYLSMILGENELSAQAATVKVMATGHETKISLEASQLVHLCNANLHHRTSHSG